MRSLLIVAAMICFLSAEAEILSPSSAKRYVESWMNGHPIMGGLPRTVESVIKFPEENTTNFVYVLQLAPSGYVVLNSNGQLPVVISYSRSSIVDLTDSPANAFRSMLLDFIKQTEGALELPVAMAAEVKTSSESTELYGPFLKTSWNQRFPFNKFCPSGAPSGCVPTSFSQIVFYHHWPPYGHGEKTYVDAWGSMVGEHYADFSDPYDWEHMLASYGDPSSYSDMEEDAVGELLYELGVVAGANYELAETGASLHLGLALETFFGFDQAELWATQAEFISPMEDDLRNGYPCVASIPNHAIVVDGLLKDGGSTTYHINYGWGGVNNGWWSASAIPGGEFEYGVTSLKPALKALPVENNVNAVVGSDVELKWIVPEVRAEEIGTLSIYRQELVYDTWSSGADETPLGSGWRINSDGRTGNCWSAGELNSSYMLVDGLYVPDSSCELHFWLKGPLNWSYFTLKATTNGLSYPTLLLVEPYQDSIPEWTEYSVTLSGYEGQTIALRFELSYYFRGGDNELKLDDLSITTDAGVMAWLPFAENLHFMPHSDVNIPGQLIRSTSISGLTEGAHSLKATLTDTNGIEHGSSPSFNITVPAASNDWDGDGIPNDWEYAYFGGETNAAPDAICSNGLNTIRECFIAGLNPNDPTNIFSISMIPANILQWSCVSGRVYSVYWSTNLLGDFHPLETNIPWTHGCFTNTTEALNSFFKIEVQLDE